jgi:hypothetical protein
MSSTPNTGVPTAGGAPSAIVGGAPSEALPTLRTRTRSTMQSKVRTPGACVVNSAAWPLSSTRMSQLLPPSFDPSTM